MSAPIILIVRALGRLCIDAISALGRLVLFALATLSQVFRPPYYLREFFTALLNVGYLSLPVVGLTALFTGAALALQIYSGGSRFNAPEVVPQIVAIGMVRELGPVLVGLMIAARVTSSIAAEMATMKVTEQIDALEIMGVNSKNYLVLPKILGFMFILPFIIIYSMVLGLFGGWVVGMASGIISSADYIYGLQYWFEPFSIFYALIKTVLFAFIIASVSSYYGYYVKGGSLEVGKASTKAVIWSSIAILFVNYLVTQLLLID